jgi:dTDP-N-acetylfucosamine:lipid II N-acetylfucosaminyltransferase
MAILHIIHFDIKFVDSIINQFEEVSPGISNYVVAAYPKDYDEVQNLKNIKIIEIVNPKYLYSAAFIDRLNKYKLILLHFLTPSVAKMLIKSNIAVPVIWMSWGADIYNDHPILKKTLYQNETLKYVKKNSNWFKSCLKGILSYANLYKSSFHLKFSAISKIQFIAPVIFDDFFIIKKYFNAPHLRSLDFSYGCIENLITSDLNNLPDLGNNILMGNSASLTNNHLDMINLLAELKLNDRIIISPLSYGNKNYADKVLDYGNEKLGTNYMPLLEFLQPDEYFKILSSCGFVVMNHCRQEGLGNIIVMLFWGAKVFFNILNPTYAYFKRLGAYVFLIDDIKVLKEKAFIPLTIREIEANRRVIMKTRSKSVVLSYTKEIVELID